MSSVALAPQVYLTRTDAVPALSPLVAVMTTMPSEMPSTRPVLSTMAIPKLLLAHPTRAPAMTFPRESNTVAVRRNEPPTLIVAFAGDTSTRLTVGAWTTIVAVPVRPSLDAVIVAVPGESAATIPVDVTVATSG
jgi:hypothetical protein